jgi:hypothetical protein
VGALATKLTCTDFTIWCLVSAVYCLVYELNVDILVVYCPSLILLDASLMPIVAECCD